MAEWNKNKVEPSAINGGKEFVKGDNLAVNELNAIVNNSFFASEKAQRAEELAESAVEGQGTPVTLNGEVLPTWSADFVENEKTISGENNSNPIIHNDDAPVVFAESERQKSKNLLVYPYANTTKTNNGITFTDNGDGSITINGTNNGSGNSNFFFTSYKYKFKKGTYTLGNFASEHNSCVVVAYDGRYYHQATANSSVTFTISEDISDDIETYIYMGVVKNDTFTFNNVVVRPMFVSGTELGDYQPYNGAIVNDKQLKEAVEKRELFYDVLNNRIDITSSTLTTLQAYFDLFKSDTSKTYICNIGALETSKFKDLLPDIGFGNYCTCFIKYYSSEMWSNGNLKAFEIIAFSQFGSAFAKGYLYKNLNGAIVFTGWTKIGG